MLITTNENFKKLIVNHWQYNAKFNYYTAPYDPSIKCYIWRREFRDKNGNVLARIDNLRDISWDWDDNIGLLQNGLCAIRIK